jgi:hypothetical protein
VVGWFTEDETYRPLAETFAANLTEHGAPFHLWAKPAGNVRGVPVTGRISPCTWQSMSVRTAVLPG